MPWPDDTAADDILLNPPNPSFSVNLLVIGSSSLSSCFSFLSTEWSSVFVKAFLLAVAACDLDRGIVPVVGFYFNII